MKEETFIRLKRARVAAMLNSKSPKGNSIEPESAFIAVRPQEFTELILATMAALEEALDDE